jgi:hypothetical protein
MYVWAIAKPVVGRKYGPRYCIVACQTRKKINATKQELITLARGTFFQRVVTPLNTSIGTALECAFAGFACTELDGSADSNGERMTQYQRDLQARLLELQSRHDKVSISDINKEAEEIRSKGAIEYLIKQIAGETTAKIAVKVIPVVGWVDLGANILAGAQRAGPALMHMNYVMNETAMVATATMALTYASELMSGSADPATLNSFSQLYAADASRDQGGGSAQSSPLYGAIMGGQTPKPAASLFPKAYAETTARAMCDDGQGYPSGALVCPNVAIGSPNGTIITTVKSVSDFANNPVLALPGFAAKLWVDLTGKLFDLISEPLSKFLG